MSKFLDSTGLTYLWQKIKGLLKNFLPYQTELDKEIRWSGTANIEIGKTEDRSTGYPTINSLPHNEGVLFWFFHENLGTHVTPYIDFEGIHFTGQYNLSEQGIDEIPYINWRGEIIYPEDAFDQAGLDGIAPVWYVQQQVNNLNTALTTRINSLSTSSTNVEAITNQQLDILLVE